MLNKSYYFFVALVFSCGLISSGNSANILAYIPYPSYSHQIVFRELWKELSLKGHQVTVVTSDPLDDPTLTNLTEISVKWSYKYLTTSENSISKVAENKMTMWNAWEIFLAVGQNVIDAQLADESIQDLIHNKSHQFNVVIVEFIYPELLAFSEIYNCPTIMAGSLEGISYLHNLMGNPSHPVLYPEILTGFAGELTFKERVTSTMFYLYTQYYAHFRHFPTKQKMIDKYFNVKRTIQEFISDIDLLFVNAKAAINGARALGPTTIPIAHERKPKQQKPLPKDVQRFLDEAKEGFVYFSLGSNVKSNELHPASLKAIVDALNEIPYKVLWKFEADELPGKPENVKIVKWAPQNLILGHPNIKLFITQGGLQSSEESIYKGVPLVVIPFYSDQPRNAKILASKGIAKVVDRHPVIDKDVLKNAILEVITEPKYKKAVMKLKHLATDEPMTGLERAIWWIEYAIRNKGTKHLRNPAADLPLYQYYLLDVIGFLLLSSLLSIYLVVILIRKVISFLFPNKKTTIHVPKSKKKS